MASETLIAQTEMTDPQDADLMYIVDDPAGTPADRKITMASLNAYINNQLMVNGAWVIKKNVWRSGPTQDTFGEIVTVTSAATTASNPSADQPFMVNYATSAVANNVAGIRSTADQFWFNHRFWYTGLILPVNNTNGRYWVGVLTNTTLANMGASATPAFNLLGFRFDPGAGDTTWQFCSNNGAAFSATDTLVAPDFTVPTLFEYRLLAGGTVDVYLDRVQVLSGLTVNYPTTTTSGLNHSCTILGGGVARNIRVSFTQVAQYYI